MSDLERFIRVVAADAELKRALDEILTKNRPGDIVALGALHGCAFTEQEAQATVDELKRVAATLSESELDAVTGGVAVLHPTPTPAPAPTLTPSTSTHDGASPPNMPAGLQIAPSQTKVKIPP